ncbi:hypothetical protein [uncultured Dokdonia sp.]|uniref:hypothetical protein n=1 Tax=uncultured Dokdonia sp. TaxID=575653 RepID=UPI00261886D7|nr:hypothetical protein [uncultured Dokdonia sp.]
MIQLKDLIQNIAEKDITVQTYAAKVVAINTPQNSIHSPEDVFTVNVIRPDGAMIKNVRLKASIQEEEQGVISIPKLDSWVLVSIIDNLETRAFISQYSEIERTFVRFKNENNQYLEIDSNADQFHILFKEAQPTLPGQAPSEFKSIAKIAFNSLESQNNGDHPSMVTTFYDGEGKLLSETLATGQVQKTVLNTIKNGEPIPRVCFDLNTTSDTVATLHFTGEDETSKQKIDITELGTTIAINEDMTVVTLLENELTITTDQGNGYMASVKDGEVLITKDDLTFKLTDLVTIEKGGVNLGTELQTLITQLQALTVPTPVGPSGPPINANNFATIGTNLSNLLV